MSTVPPQRAGAGPAHSATTARHGWGPTPRSTRSYTAHGDGRAVTALRVTAYVLTSLASVVFLLLAGYGMAQYSRSVAVHQLDAADPDDGGSARVCDAVPPVAADCVRR